MPKIQIPLKRELTLRNYQPSTYIPTDSSGYKVRVFIGNPLLLGGIGVKNNYVKNNTLNIEISSYLKTMYYGSLTYIMQSFPNNQGEVSGEYVELTDNINIFYTRKLIDNSLESINIKILNKDYLPALYEIDYLISILNNNSIIPFEADLYPLEGEESLSKIVDHKLKRLHSIYKKRGPELEKPDTLKVNGLLKKFRSITLDAFKD